MMSTPGENGTLRRWVTSPSFVTVEQRYHFNNKIKVIKRQAYGFRDDAYFILKIKGAFPGTLQRDPR